MVEFIKTQRLEIRPFSGEDRKPLSVLLCSGEIKKTYMIPDFETPQALDKMIDTLLDLSLSPGHFVRGIYSGAELVGFVNDVQIENGCIELGYVIHPAHWRKGYATEMLDAVIHALLGHPFSSIKTGAFSENAASLRVMEKCGMKKCPQEEQISYRGKTHTCIYYEAALSGG